MKRDYIEFQERSVPRGFLITIRCYGTSLHGDKRGSMNRRSFNSFGYPSIPANSSLDRSDESQLKAPKFILGANERRIVKYAIREVCRIRGYGLPAINVRTNHAHSVVGAASRPEHIMNSFKSYATRRLREHGLVAVAQKVWSRHGSTRYLWTEDHMATAIQYVLFGQGDELPHFD
jgi:REP element-mobilizing transposase RayT